VGTVVKESKKFFDGGIELLRFGSRIIGNNQETKKPVKQLSKIEIK